MGGLLEILVSQFIDQNRAPHLENNAKEDERDIVQNGVPRHAGQLPVDHDRLEILQPDPGGVVDAAPVLVFFEGQHQAAHGYVAENNHVYDRGNQHHQKQPVLPENLPHGDPGGDDFVAVRGMDDLTFFHEVSPCLRLLFPHAFVCSGLNFTIVPLPRQ